MKERTKSALRFFAKQAHYINLAFLTTWATIPEKFQDSLPVPWVIAIAGFLIVTGVVSSYFEQKDKA